MPTLAVAAVAASMTTVIVSAVAAVIMIVVVAVVSALARWRRQRRRLIVGIGAALHQRIAEPNRTQRVEPRRTDDVRRTIIAERRLVSSFIGALRHTRFAFPMRRRSRSSPGGNEKGSTPARRRRANASPGAERLAPTDGFGAR
jgi:hypothetical protein